MIDLVKYSDFLITKDLTPDEFLFLYTLYFTHYIHKETGKSIIKRYTEKFGVDENGTKKMMPESLKQSLINKGYLQRTEGTGSNQYMLSPKFTDNFIDEYTAGEEFYDLYPAMVKIQGVSIPLKTARRAEIRSLYFIAIKGDAEEHKKVLEDIQYGIDNELINMKIINFVESEFWRELRKMRGGNKKIITETDDF